MAGVRVVGPMPTRPVPREPVPTAVDSLSNLLIVLENAPTITMVSREWTKAQLTGLSLREGFSAKGYWACVQVAGVIIDGQTYRLSETLDAHISLGTWKNDNSLVLTKWSHYFSRVARRLAQTSLMDMDLTLNARASDDKHLVFSFMVHSRGRTILESSSSTLNHCGGTQSESPPRGMSPPGQVFHLSVYDNAR